MEPQEHENGGSRERSVIVMTFNLRRSSWADGRNAWRYRRGSAAEAILAADADVVGTQEGSFAMLQELSASLPSFAWIGEGRRGGARDETNAILYRADRWVPERSGTFWLSETPERPGSRAWGAAFPRICTWASFRSLREDSLRWAVFNTHLDHISAPARRRGIELVVRRAAALAGDAPLALTGDFNAKPGGDVEETLREAGWRNVFDAMPEGAAGATFHGFRGGGERGKPIDYIYYKGFREDPDIRVDRARYGGKLPSDHYPVTAALRWI